MNFQVLGDTHLGRTFRTGVPLHRIGDREAMVWKQFETNLMEAPPGMHIHMGDLFDKFVVPPEVVLRAAEIYDKAALANPATTYVVLMGNHDPSKDRTKRSSFDIFEALAQNVIVVRTPLIIENLGFLPYSVFGTAEESLKEILEQGTPEIVFGHWDVVDFGGANVIPTQSLSAAGIMTAYTGHDHRPREEKRHGVTINVVGSMQPYTHAEDDTCQWYVTLPLAETVGRDFSQMNLRVLLAEDEVLPMDINCLSILAKRVADTSEDPSVDTEEFEGVDLAVELAGLLPEEIRAEVMEIFGK